MKFFLGFCLLYSFTLFADNPIKLNQAKKILQKTSQEVQALTLGKAGR